MNLTYKHAAHPIPQFRRLCIFGAGGSGRETASLARRAWGQSVELTFVVDSTSHVTDPVNGVPVVSISDLSDTHNAHFIASVGNIKLRKTAVTLCERAGMVAITAVHPNTEISEMVRIGSGTIIYAGVIATTNVTIGSHAQINIGCTISHDVKIGDFSTLSPGCHISGHVHIGRDVFIGTGANVINGRPDAPLVIGDGAVIAAGACVIASVTPGSLVVGVPARQKR